MPDNFQFKSGLCAIKIKLSDSASLLASVVFC